jgi:hypothetical protein
MKERILIVLVVALAATVSLVWAAGVPIVDGTNLPYGIEDPVGHLLLGLQVERGDGFVTVALPRSSDHRTVWGIHALITFTDATIKSVEDFGLSENGGDNGEANIIGNSRYSDEVDYVGDSVRVPAEQAYGVTSINEAEFWMATNSGQDAFKFALEYESCPYMRIELVDIGQLSYNMSLQSFEIGGTPYSYGVDIPLTDCRRVAIDIKPGSDPNCFNSDGHGVIPVAILGSADFNVDWINQSTVQLEGLSVKVVGKKTEKLLAHTEDVNGDGFDDLVVQIEDQDGAFTSGNGTAKVTGELSDGTPFEGADDICIVP